MKKALIILDPGLFTKIEAVAGFHYRTDPALSKLTGSLIAEKGFAYFAPPSVSFCDLRVSIPTTA
jgi:hypothetical protein